MSGRRYLVLLAFAALILTPHALAVMFALLAARLVIGVARALGHRGSAVAGRSPERSSPADSAEIVLGSDGARRPVTLTPQQLSAHGLILGASGSGKSTTLLRILTDAIRSGHPVIAIDLKGSPSFERVLAGAAAAAGRPFRVWSADGAEHWNPLGHGNATELKDKLIATERFTEPHYQRAAERYVQTVLQVLAHLHPGRPPTLAEVVAAMEPNRLSAACRRLPRPVAERVQDYVANMSPDQWSAVRGLATRLAIVTESHTGRYLEPPAPGEREGIDLRRALAGEEVVLFSLNSSTYGKLAAQIGTLAIQDLVCAAGARISASGEERRGPQAIVGLDEFSALGADHVVSLLGRARAAGVSVVLATQELADLDRAAPGLREQVIGNTAIKIAHRQDVPSSAQTISQMAGTEKAWEELRPPMGAWLLGAGSPRAARRRVERFVVHPNDVKTLRTGEAVVITKLPESRVRTVRVAAPRGLDLG